MQTIKTKASDLCFHSTQVSGGLAQALRDLGSIDFLVLLPNLEVAYTSQLVIRTISIRANYATVEASALFRNGKDYKIPMITLPVTHHKRPLSQ